MSHMIAKQLGDRIKELRKETGLSQEKFALKIDMDRTYFATVESGKRNISLQNIEKIANGLNITISELFEGIEILVSIDIGDTEDGDSQKLRAKLKGAILSGQDKVYIKVKATYDEKELVGIPVLYWGGDAEDLEEMKVHGTFFDIDYVFNVFYIDAYVDLYTLFKKNANTLLVNDKEQDKEILENIQKACDDLNTQISGLSGIKTFEERIAPEYKKYRHEDVSVSVKSEIAVKGLYSNIVPYIKQDSDNSLYPTSGEGRKKLLVYAIFDLLSKEEEEKKINLFLIEEPENHLHRSMQIALSHILFHDEKYQYLFRRISRLR